jgi:hypothetical protein
MSHLNGNGSAGWPASALAAAEKAFTLLTTPPAPLVFDTRTIGHGLPAGMVPLDQLRALLLKPGTCDAARDACWHLLVDHARRWGPAWVVAAVGMALPALTRMAGRLCAGHSRRADDIEAELLTGFLDGLRHADLSGPAPYVRLCWLGWRQARQARGGDTTAELPELPEPGGRTPARPYGHPDLILNRAAVLGYLTSEQADLISATRLGHELIDDIAARQGVDASVLRMRRRRGELAIQAVLNAGLIDPARPIPKNRPDTASRTRRNRPGRAGAAAGRSRHVRYPVRGNHGETTGTVGAGSLRHATSAIFAKPSKSSSLLDLSDSRRVRQT